MELPRLNALFEEGDQAMRRTDFEAAATAYSTVIQLDTSSVKAYLNRANCYLRLQMLTQCLSDLNFVLIHPEFDEKWKIKGRKLKVQCLMLLKQFEECEKTLEEFANCADDTAMVWSKKQLVNLRHVKALQVEFEQAEKLRTGSGNEWTILPKTWFDAWQSYVKQQSMISPGGIDCSGFMVNLDSSIYYIDPHLRFKHTNTILREDAKEQIDFILVPHPMYEFLSERYGSSGESLKRYMDNGQVELWYRKMKADVIGLIDTKTSLTPKVLMVSRTDTVAMVKDKLIRCLKQVHSMANVHEATARLWKLSSSDQKQVTDRLLTPSYLTEGINLKSSELLPDPNAVVLGADDLLLIEFQRISGNWILSIEPKDLCIQCHKSGATNICGGCRAVRYCSKTCQNLHFKIHKNLCKKNRVDVPKVLPPRRGLCGLQNLGNTCFMSSAIQCLSHVEPLTTYFLSGRYIQDLNKSNPLGTGGRLAKSYADLLRLLWEGTESSIAPWDFRKTLAKAAPQFSGFLQHDSQELLSYLLDGLHEDLNKVEKKVLTESVEGSGTDDERVAAEAWENHLKRNKSVLVDMMHGQCKSTLVCPQCHRVSITFDPFLTHTLQLANFESKKVAVFFIPLTHRCPIKLTFVVRNSTTIQTVKSLITQQTNTRNLVLWTITNRKLQKCLTDLQTLEDAHGQTLFAYESEETWDYSIQVLQTRDADDVISWSRVVFVKKTDTVDTLHLKVASALLWVIQNITSQQFQSIEEAYDRLFPPGQQGLYSLLILSTRDRKTLSKCDFCDSKSCRNCPIPRSSTLTVEQLLSTVKSKSYVPTLEVRWMKSTRDLRFLDYSQGTETPKFVEESKGPTLDECIRLSSRPEVLDADNTWYCNRCAAHVQATKVYEFYKTPQVLILHLKRFKPRLLEKLDIKVDFPLEGLEISPLSVSQPLIYDLFAVSNHLGSTYGGHYTAYVRSERVGGWFEMDDHAVRPLTNKDIVTRNAYILFYRLRTQEE